MSPEQEVACDRLRDEFGVPAEFAILIASNLNSAGLSNAIVDTTASGILRGGFVWASTEEGRGFWCGMQSAIVSETGEGYAY